MAFSVELGPVLEKYVSKLVKSGRYNSKSEVLREGVRLVQDRETRLADFETSIARGMADIEAGRTIPAEEVFARLKEKYQYMADGQEPTKSKP